MLKAEPGAASSGFTLLLSSAPDTNTAEKLARLLVESKLAACVSLLPQATSIYSWEGKIEQATETLLLIKTKSTAVEQIETLFSREHPYQVPELLSLPLTQIGQKYQNWLSQVLA